MVPVALAVFFTSDAGILILWEVDDRPSFPRRDQTGRDETRRSLPMSELTRSTLTRTEETLMNACEATTTLSLVQRVFALMQRAGSSVAGDNYDDSRLATVVNSLGGKKVKSKKLKLFQICG